MPSLYVIATPIGNLEDVTFRAIRILKDVKLIAAEDTRKTKQLLSAYNITTPTTSYHEHNKISKLEYIITCLEQYDIALVSDAGMPGISDPGYELILAAYKHKFPVIPIPGPSVLVTALAVSGLPGDSFIYLGFLPHKSGDRRRLLKSIEDETRTMVVFEAPHRICDSLQDMLSILGERQIAVCREMTKIHEEVFRGTLTEAITHFISPKGEFTLIISGKQKESKPVLNSNIESKLKLLKKSGTTAKDAIINITRETGISKKELYQAWLKIE